MAKLVRTDLGVSARDSFCAELQQLPYGSGILVLPNSLLVDDVQQRYGGVEAMGMDRMANKLLNSNGYVKFEEISRRSQELIVQDFVRMLSAQQGLEYFGLLAEKPGFIKAMTSLITELSSSGATTQEISDILRAWGRTGKQCLKDKEVAAIYQAYRFYIKDKNWFDLEGKYRLAIRVLQSDKVRIPWQHVYFCDFYSFDRLKLDFIKELAQHIDVTVGMCYEKDRDEVFGAVRRSYNDLEQFCDVESLQPSQEIEDHAMEISLFDADDTCSDSCCIFRRNFGCTHVVEPAPCGRVRSYVFATREAEMRWVLSQVKQKLQHGGNARRTLVAVRKLDDYSGLRLLADEYGIPVSLPLTSNLAVQPLVELVRLLLAAVPDNRDGAEAYLALLRKSLASLLLQCDSEMVDDLRTQFYFTSRTFAQQKVQEMLAHAAESLDAWNEMIAAIPQHALLSEYVEHVRSFVKNLQLPQRLGALYKAGKLPLDAVSACLAASQSLETAMTALLKDYTSCEHGEDKMNVQQFSDLLLEAAAEKELTLAAGRADGVLITEAINVQGLQFDDVYILGLREGEFPSAGNENWIYNDKERGELNAMGLDLPTTAQAYAEDNYFFAAGAATAREQLVLTYSDEDGAQPSPYLTAVQKLFYTENAEGERTAMQPVRPVALEKLPASAAEAAQRTSCDSAWLSATYGEESLEAAQADALRAENPQGAYNGVLDDAELQQAVRRRVGTSFSASALEIYAACPFQYLGTRVWKQQEFAALDDEVQPADEGSLLHEVLARFIAQHLEQRLADDSLEDLQTELQQIFDAVSDEYLEQGAITSSVLWDAEQPRLWRLLRAWLAFEYEEQQHWNYLPSAVEWDFSSRNGKPLALYLQDGSRVSLNGRIDRIDSDGSHVFVTDYKRSSAPSAKDADEGFDVQLPLYLLAAGKMYKGGMQVSGGAYYVLKDGLRKSPLVLADTGNGDLPYKEKREISKDWQKFTAFCTALLKEYIEKIYSGQFGAMPRKNCSPYCPLKTICRIGVVNAGSSARKGETEHA